MPDERRPGGPPRGNRPPGDQKPPPKAKGLLTLAVLFLSAIMVMTLLSRGAARGQEELKMNELRSHVKAGRVESLVFQRERITGAYRDEAEREQREFFAPVLETQIANFEEFLTEHNERMEEAGEPVVEYTSDRGNEFLQAILPQLLLWALLFLFFWWMISRQLRSSGGPGGVLSFGKSRAKMLVDERVEVTFKDVAGVEEAKEEVQEIVHFLKSPKQFTRLGARIPRGVLLVGSPGTGKTLLAKAIAGEAGVPFFSISGSDFVEMFVGVGASRVRDLFKEAKERGPSIIFLDEIDAVGRRRGSGIGGGHDEREQTLNAILVEMDGFERDAKVIVIASTNRPDVLDPALRRPGRFDRTVVVDLPDIRGREAILKVHAAKYKLSDSVELNSIARTTSGLSGADLEAVMNEAALTATRLNKDCIDNEDLEQARDKVRWGREKHSRVMDDEDRRITAVHESGHAIVAMLLDEVEPLHKVSIISQGMALGMTMSLPEKDTYHMEKKKLLGQLCLLMAGRVAEEEFCDDITTGASSDLNNATDLARNMVCRWGMSEALGPVSYHEGEDTVFLGREITRSRNHSEAMALRIDQEIRNLIVSQHDRAQEIVHAHREDVRRLTEALMRHEALYREEVEKILAGEELVQARSSRPAELVLDEDESQEAQDRETAVRDE